MPSSSSRCSTQSAFSWQAMIPPRFVRNGARKGNFTSPGWIKNRGMRPSRVESKWTIITPSNGMNPRCTPVSTAPPWAGMCSSPRASSRQYRLRKKLIARRLRTRMNRSSIPKLS